MVGGTLTLDFDAPNTSYNGAYTISEVLSPTSVVTTTPNSGSFTNPGAGTGNIYAQPANTANELDSVLEPYWEYIAIVTAIKATAKEEGDTNDLLERRNVMRQDITDSAGNDDNEPNGIVDVQDGSGGLGWL